MKEDIFKEIGKKLQPGENAWPRINKEKYFNLDFFEKVHVYCCYNYACNQGWAGKDFSKWTGYLEAAETDFPFQSPAEKLKSILAKVKDNTGRELTGDFIMETVHYSINKGTNNETACPKPEL